LNVNEYNCQEKGINLCSDYDESSSCTIDICGISSNSIPSEIDCDEVDCSCYWDNNENECAGGVWNSTYNNGNSGVGFCFYNENSVGNCDNGGNLEYSWNATWTWDSSNVGYVSNPGAGYVQGKDGKWYYDPEQKKSMCKDGSNSIPCPAQAQLPLNDGIYAMIIILVIIALVYLIILKKRSHKTKKISRKSTKKKRK
jgi:hypothetical protein